MAKVIRIPLDVVVTGTGDRTPGVLVGVMVADLNRLEARLEAAEAAAKGRSWARRKIERAYA